MMDKQEELIVLLKVGDVVIMPTDTVYGLVSLAEAPEAVRKMYEVKQRDGKPGTIIAWYIWRLSIVLLAKV